MVYGPPLPRVRWLGSSGRTAPRMAHQGRRRTLRHHGRVFSHQSATIDERHGSKPCGGHQFPSILWFLFAVWRSEGVRFCGSRSLITFFFFPRSCTVVLGFLRGYAVTGPRHRRSRFSGSRVRQRRLRGGGPRSVDYSAGSIDKTLFLPAVGRIGRYASQIRRWA